MRNKLPDHRTYDYGTDRVVIKKFSISRHRLHFERQAPEP